MKKAIVLGGTHDHIRLVELLKTRGFYTILVDYYENPPAKFIADEHVRESTLDKENVLKIAKKINPDLVIALCIDQALLTMAYVSENLELPCHIPYSTALEITNKVLMKQKMILNEIPTSNFTVLNETSHFKLRNLSFPLVVKPSDANSSKGITKIFSTADMDMAITRAHSQSSKKQVIIEEFSEGTEFSADLLIVDGKTHLIMVTENIKTDCKENFTIFQSKYPATTDQTILEKIKLVAGKIAQAYDLKNAPLLIQMIHTNGSLQVIEFSARIGGGSKHQFIKYITGFDFLNSSLDIIQGKRPVIKYTNKNIFACVNYLYANKGVINEFIGFEEQKKRGYIEAFFYYKTLGMRVHGKTTSSDRPAGYLVADQSEESMVDKIREIEKSLKILDQNGHDIMIHIY